MTDSERIQAVIEYSKKSRRALGIALGYTDGSFLFHVINGRNGISVKLAKKITDLFPEVSYDWLLKNKGEMIVEVKPAPKDDLTLRIEFLERHIKGQDARIELLERKMNEMASTSNEVPQKV